MQKTILITGSTDGIGLGTAKVLYAQGHHILLHGRSPGKLAAAQKTLAEIPGDGKTTGYLADLSSITMQANLLTHMRMRWMRRRLNGSCWRLKKILNLSFNAT